MISRRAWVATVAAAGGTWYHGGLQQGGEPVRASGNLFDMDQGASRTVRRPPKPGATASMSPEQRDALEHRIRCQCGCTMDVFTCRTTDFTCQVSPAMHRDVMALVEGGYGEREILGAFVEAYGEAVLMAPPRQGFNLVGYVLPGIGIAVGAVLLAIILRGLRRSPEPARAEPLIGVDATPEELARLADAVKDDRP